MEIEEEPYEGHVISYPKIPIDTSGWTVNLATNDMSLLGKLGGRAKIFKGRTREDAIAQAKRHVNALR
jgi:hypothetical protein